MLQTRKEIHNVDNAPVFEGNHLRGLGGTGSPLSGGENRSIDLGGRENVLLELCRLARHSETDALNETFRVQLEAERNLAQQHGTLSKQNRLFFFFLVWYLALANVATTLGHKRDTALGVRGLVPANRRARVWELMLD